MLGQLLLDVTGNLPRAFSDAITAADAALATAGGAYAVILIPVGLVLCFFGRFLWMLWIFLGGAFLGGIAGGTLFIILGITGPDANPGIGMAIGALVGGWIAIQLYILSMFVIGFMVSAALYGFAAASGALPAEPVLALSVMFVGGISFVMISSVLLALLTAFIGANMVAHAVWILAAPTGAYTLLGAPVFWIRRLLAFDNLGGTETRMVLALTVTVVTFFVLVILGTYFQLRLGHKLVNIKSKSASTVYTSATEQSGRKEVPADRVAHEGFSPAASQAEKSAKLWSPQRPRRNLRSASIAAPMSSSETLCARPRTAAVNYERDFKSGAAPEDRIGTGVACPDRSPADRREPESDVKSKVATASRRQQNRTSAEEQGLSKYRYLIVAGGSVCLVAALAYVAIPDTTSNTRYRNSGSNVESVPRVPELLQAGTAPAPEGTCFLVVASRKQRGEARAILETYPSSQGGLWRSENGWIAVVLGRLANDKADAVIALRQVEGAIPHDAFCTRGSAFVRRID